MLYEPESRIRVREMRRKILFGLMLIALVLGTSLLVQAQASIVQNDLVSRKPGNKPPKPPGKGSEKGGIATGEVSAPQDENRRWAIIIGISDYSEINDLRFCDEDALDMLDALLDYGYPRDNIRLLISDGVDNNASLSDIVAAVDWLLGEVSSEEDEVVFFYAGHGSRSNYDMDGDRERRDECIISSDDQYIWDGTLTYWFDGIASQRLFFYFDSCYAGGMTDLAGYGRLICMACRENQVAFESQGLQNGLFTHYFVDQGILERKADLNTVDGIVTFEEAFDYAVANISGQTPQASDNFNDDMQP